MLGTCCPADSSESPTAIFTDNDVNWREISTMLFALLFALVASVMCPLSTSSNRCRPIMLAPWRQGADDDIGLLGSKFAGRIAPAIKPLCRRAARLGPLVAVYRGSAFPDGAQEHHRGTSDIRKLFRIIVRVL
jgi:hypothetical protein